METLFALQRQLIQNSTTSFVRSVMGEIDLNGTRLIGVRGARGVGKTTLLLQHIKLNFGAGTKKAGLNDKNDAFFEDMCSKRQK